MHGVWSRLGDICEVEGAGSERAGNYSDRLAFEKGGKEADGVKRSLVTPIRPWSVRAWFLLTHRRHQHP